jgi:hypothetical protein
MAGGWSSGGNRVRIDACRTQRSQTGPTEIRTSGLMSGDGKRGGASASVLAPIFDSTTCFSITSRPLVLKT